MCGDFYESSSIACYFVILLYIFFKVNYYDSGRFGDEQCDYCDEPLLPKEKEKFKMRKTTCCWNGECETPQMRAEFEELQNPPKEFRELLKEEHFLKNTMPLNTNFAFASTSSEHAPDDQCGGRPDTCKYNGF
jgi:hypothetical protein